MSFSVGIGIVTYNRKEIVSETIDRVRAFTRQSDAALVVADDGSTDGTLEMLRDKQVPLITGVNMGAPWNKNRALFLLSHMLGCPTIILLEDDTGPKKPSWEIDWIKAAQLWGHMNYAGDWMSEHFLSGAGTPEDPVQAHMVTAQCAAFSRDALTYGGFFDPRFKGYGHAHVEHSNRLIRLGFGGINQTADGTPMKFFSIKSDLHVAACQTYFDEAQRDYNFAVAKQVMGQQGYRAPWADDSQMRQFRSETESAMSEGPGRFRLTPNASLTAVGRPLQRGFFGRLFRRF